MPFLLGVLLRLLTRGVPIWFDTELVSAEDMNALEYVQLVAGGEGSQVQSVACSRLRPCFGFFIKFGTQGWGALQRVTDAGKTTGVSGANVAYFQGRIAALSAGFDAGKIDLAT